MALLGISLSSCLSSEFNKLTDQTADTFDYSTTSVKNVNVTLFDAKNNPVQGVVVEVYQNSPFDELGQLIDSISPLAKILTNASGYGSSVIDIATSTEKVYLVTKFPGYANPDTLDVSVGVPTAMIYPAGYGTSSISVSQISTKSAAAVVSDSYTPVAYSIKDYNNVWVLGSFSSTSGLPAFLATSDVISNTLKSDISASLPESRKVPNTHPEFLEDASMSNIKLIDDCEIWVTFVTEGASFLNTLGYFYYPTGSSPSSVSEINKKIIVFPNASFVNSGGSLKEGDKVKLKYYNEQTNTWTDTFPKGLTVSWFLIADGFKSGKIGGANQYWDFSIPAFNSGSYQQSIILYDESEEKMVIAFEDVSRTYKSCDEDFNDAIFYATANPIDAIATDDLNDIVLSDDADGDGARDVDDEFPNDAKRAFTKYYPGQNVWGTLAYEDLWPKKGDYDLNDFVTLYNSSTVTNADGDVVDINMNFQVLAAGAINVNGFAFQIGTEPSNVESISGFNALSNAFNLNSNGTEAGQTKAVIPVIDNIKQLLGGLSLVNTSSSGNTSNTVTLSEKITLINPVSEDILGIPPYNPFLIANIDSERGKEIHLSGMSPTDLVESSYFGTEQDLSDVNAGLYYVADLGFPWALKIPETVPYPIEKVKISDAYLMFSKWVKSSGKEYTDWYKDIDGYRVDDQLYSK